MTPTTAPPVTLPPGRSRGRLPRAEYALAALAIAAFFLLVFGPTLQSGFYVVEDHTLFRRGSSAISDWLTRVGTDARVYGRFRPGYQLYVVASFQAFGSNPQTWHTASLLWGGLTCYLFFLAFRMVGADIVTSTFFILLFALTGTQNWIWINLVPAETSGMLMTAVAVWAIVAGSRRAPSGSWHALMLVPLALAGFAKESFVLLVPALLLLRVACHRMYSGESWPRSIRSLKVPLVAGSLIFVAQIAAIVGTLLSVPVGYSANAAGTSLESFDPRHWLQLLTVLPLTMRLAGAAAVPVWAAAWYRRRDDRAALVVVAAIVALWVVPQLVLYKNGLQERYLFPLVVGVAGAIALGLSELRQSPRLWPLWPVGLLALMPMLGTELSATTGILASFVAETKATSRMVTFLAQNVPAGEPIVMAGDSGTAYGFEATYALPLYLKAAGSSSPFYLWPLVSKGERSPMHVAASENNTAFKLPASLDSADVGAIVIVDKWIPGFDLGPLQRWLGDTAWRETSFTEPYQTFSIRALRFVPSGEVTHRVLLSSRSRGVPGARPLMVIQGVLTRVVDLGPLLEAPPWGLERDYAGPGSIVWLGHGDAEGLGGTLTSTRHQSVEMDMEVVPGPSRPGFSRTVELDVDTPSGRVTQRETFDGGRWTFRVNLEPGANRFRLRVTDESTMAVQPNGDTRTLLALVRRVTIRDPGPR